MSGIRVFSSTTTKKAEINVTDLPASGRTGLTYNLTAQSGMYPPGQYVWDGATYQLLLQKDRWYKKYELEGDGNFTGALVPGATYSVHLDRDLLTIEPSLRPSDLSPVTVNLVVYDGYGSPTITWNNIYWMTSLPNFDDNALIVTLVWDGTNRWQGFATRIELGW